MKYQIIIFGLGLALGLLLSFLWNTLLIETTFSGTKSEAAKTIKREVEKVSKTEEAYTQSFDSLQRRSTMLHTELKDTKTALAQAKQKSGALQTEVQELIGKRFSTAVTVRETSEDCDSLIVTVQELIQSSFEKDSLHQTLANNLESQVKNKDSTLVLKDSLYAELKTSFTNGIATQQSLLKENTQLLRQYKKQKVKSKVLSAALFVISGAAINQFLRR